MIDICEACGHVGVLFKGLCVGCEIYMHIGYEERSLVMSTLIANSLPPLTDDPWVDALLVEVTA